MSTLRVVTMGALSLPVAEDLCRFLSQSTGMRCRFGGKGPDPSFSLLPERDQFNARALITVLEHGSSPHERVLGIVDIDLCSKVFTFVFGEAVLGGQAAVISMHRLHPERYGLPPDHGLVQDRLRRVALHETGHLLGLVHCRKPDCVMRFSGSVEELDLKRDRLCPECLAALSPSGSGSPAAPDPERTPG